MKKHCPNPACQSHQFIKDGTYQRSSDHRVIQRFRCQSCSRRFSNASFDLACHQNKRTLNHTIFKLLSSSVSMRRIAKILLIDKKTVQRKVEFLNQKALLKQKQLLAHTTVTHLQFDDLITLEHTKLKPVSISLAVDVNTRLILGAQSSQIPAFGHLAQLSRQKYGSRISGHKQGLKQLFESIQGCVDSHARVDSDEHNLYPEVVRSYLPQAQHYRFKGGRACVVGQGELKKLRRDPLFCINHTCGMLRDNLKRLARKTWCTTKKIEMLQKHLNIYIWYHNYEILNKT